MNKRIQKMVCLAGCVLTGTISVAIADGVEPPEWEVLYQQDFEEVEVGSLPDDFFVLDGDFSVGMTGNGKCLVLPGNPIGEFGFLFGPRFDKKNVECAFSFWTKNLGRRFSSLECAIGGIRGFRLRLDGVAKSATFRCGDTILTEKCPDWNVETWTSLRFRASVSDENSNMVASFKLWEAKDYEPVRWLHLAAPTDPLPMGRCLLWGYPYAGTEILWDDLQIRALR